MNPAIILYYKEEFGLQQKRVAKRFKDFRMYLLESVAALNLVANFECRGENTKDAVTKKASGKKTRDCKIVRTT